jgi:hypothetical protein
MRHAFPGEYDADIALSEITVLVSLSESIDPEEGAATHEGEYGPWLVHYRARDKREALSLIMASQSICGSSWEQDDDFIYCLVVGHTLSDVTADIENQGFEWEEVP